MPYVDLNTIHVPVTGAVAPAAWGTGVRTNDEFFIDPPACNVFNSVPVSVANDTNTLLNANSERFDNDAMHSTVSQTSRITCQTAGRYELTAAITFAVAAAGVRSIAFLINGTTRSLRHRSGSGTSGEAVVFGTDMKTTLAVGDYVECEVRHTSGGALDCTLNEFTAEFITR
jgi:hypothetical protein